MSQRVWLLVVFAATAACSTEEQPVEIGAAGGAPGADPAGAAAGDDETGNGAGSAHGGDAVASRDGGAKSGADATAANPNDRYGKERARCFDMTNGFRARVGLPALAHATEKESCVDDQARQESLIDTPHGKLYLCGERRQNHGDGTGWENLELIQMILTEQFNEGPGGPHYEQMMDRSATRLACGFYTRADGNFWIDVDFF